MEIDKELVKKERDIQRILTSQELLTEHRQDLVRYEDYLKSRHKLTGTRRHYLMALLNFSKSVRKPYKDVTRDDIQQYFILIRDKSENTIYQWEFIIKMFFQWLYNMPRKIMSFSHPPQFH